MKRYQLHKLQQRREFVQGCYLVGIDPAKHRHQAQILTPDGLPHGSSFSFSATFDGFHDRIWKHLAARLPEPLTHRPRHELTDHLVFAVEASCNLWPGSG